MLVQLAYIAPVRHRLSNLGYVARVWRCLYHWAVLQIYKTVSKFIVTDTY